MRKLACLAFAIFEAAAFAQPRPHVPSRLLVGFRQGVPDSQVDAVVRSLQGRGHEQIPGTRRACCFAARQRQRKRLHQRI